MSAVGPGAPEPGPVVDWYRRHARDLPWRRPGTGPYAVLVCEVMSQQTPVARVVPAWQADPQLCGQLFLLLEDGRTQLADVVLEYSPTTGLKEVHPE